jgi:hypothetical protein
MPGNVDQNQLIQLLLDEKLLNKRQLKNALTEQQKTGKPLSQVLIDLRLVTKGVLTELESRTLGVEQIRLLDQNLDPAILTLIPRRMAEQYRAVPVRLSANELTIAMENPHDVLALDDIKLHTGKIIKPLLCSNKDIDFALKYYPDGGEISAIAVKKPLKIVQLIANLIFVLVLFAPLLLLIWLISENTNVAKWISNYEHLFIILLWWGFYSIILYWGYGIFFEEKKEKPKSSESSQS